MAALDHTSFVRVRGARENNLKNIDVDIPRVAEEDQEPASPKPIGGDGSRLR